MATPNIALIGPLDRNAPRPGQYAAPPLGIHRLAAYVRRFADVQVHVLDPCLIGPRAGLQSLRSFQPTLVGFSTLAPTLEADLRMAALVKRLLPQSLVIFGGQGVAGLERFLVEEGGADVVVRGFGEEPFTNLARLHTNHGQRCSTALKSRMFLT